MNTCTLQYKFDDVTVQYVNMPLKLIRNTKLINQPANVRSIWVLQSRSLQRIVHCTMFLNTVTLILLFTFELSNLTHTTTQSCTTK